MFPRRSAAVRSLCSQRPRHGPLPSLMLPLSSLLTYIFEDTLTFFRLILINLPWRHVGTDVI